MNSDGPLSAVSFDFSRIVSTVSPTKLRSSVVGRNTHAATRQPLSDHLPPAHKFYHYYFIFIEISLLSLYHCYLYFVSCNLYIYYYHYYFMTSVMKFVDWLSWFSYCSVVHVFCVQYEINYERTK